MIFFGFRVFFIYFETLSKVAGRNRQEVGGSAAFAAAFTKMKSLEEITLHQNGITWKGAVALANCFKLGLSDDDHLRANG